MEKRKGRESRFFWARLERALAEGPWFDAIGTAALAAARRGDLIARTSIVWEGPSVIGGGTERIYEREYRTRKMGRLVATECWSTGQYGNSSRSDWYLTEGAE